MTSAVAVLSLGLAIGACVSAFRIIDALFLRPLPVAAPERLYAIVHRGMDFDGIPQTGDGWMYPMFRQMRAAIKQQAELLAVSYAANTDVFVGQNPEAEKAHVQYVSGSLFASFGIQPAIGQALTEADDLEPHSHPFAMLSFDYWTRRFAKSPGVLNSTLRIGNDVYTIIGVTKKGFTGTEPGTMIDVFLPIMMNPNIARDDVNWFRIFVHLHPGVTRGPVRERLHSVYHAFRVEQLKTVAGLPRQIVDGVINQNILLKPAQAGLSDMQGDYREALTVLIILVALVLLIACANVANLMAAQAAARAREMALRISIGAGRLRLVQLVLTEAFILALLASSAGAMFAWWSAPFIVARVNPPDNPARLALTVDWRLIAFSLAATFMVAVMFGLAPAVRASSVRPVEALRAGANARSIGGLANALVGLQVAFCFLALLLSGLFTATLRRISEQPTGFEANHVLTVETVTPRESPASYWTDAADRLQRIPGVEAVAVADWPLLSENAAGGFISTHGISSHPTPAFFLSVSPGWMNAMRIPIVSGRDFRDSDMSPKVAIVNEAFVKRFFSGTNALGNSFATTYKGHEHNQIKVIGIVRNARYADLRGPMPAVAYFPFRMLDAKGALRKRNSGAFVVRTRTGTPLLAAAMIRQEILRGKSGLRITRIRTQSEINSLQTIRERMIAMLSIFFAGTAMLLAGVGLYGVLDYTIIQRRREIGILMAIGAQPVHIVRRVASNLLVMVLAGAAIGFSISLVLSRYIGSLVYEVKPTDVGVIAVPLGAIIATALLATTPPLIHAMRTDPLTTIRSE